MIDPTADELEALEKAKPTIVNYLSREGLTHLPLAQFSMDQVNNFLKVIIGSYLEEKLRLGAPFDQVSTLKESVSSLENVISNAEKLVRDMMEKNARPVSPNGYPMYDQNQRLRELDDEIPF